MALSASLAPSGNFDLSNWKITLPVDSSGGITGTAVEVQNLTNYTSSFFYTATDGAMVFRAAVDGATTSGSSYARSELREMIGTTRAAWNLTTGGVMTATLEVDAVPTRFDGTMGKVVVGQIHGQNDELVRLYWDANKVYFANDQSGAYNTENKFYFFNSAGLQPNVSLNEKFSYVIDAKGSTLEVSIYADGDVYKSVTPINSVWQSDTFYFKAGVYLGVNETQGTGYGQTSFYDVRFNHTDTPLTPYDVVGAPTQPSEPVQEPVAPLPAPGVAKLIGEGVTQLEGMALTGFTMLSASAASGGTAVESRTKDVSSSAKATFSGESGTYNLKLDYFDENDGAAQFAIKVNGQTVRSWTADQNLGSAVAVAQTLTAQEFQLVLNKGDTLEVVGIRKDNDLARIDDITLTKVAVTAPTAPTPSDPIVSVPTPIEPAPTPAPAPGEYVLPTTTNTVSGTLSNNYVKGTAANDLMKGLTGRDVLWGGVGSDVMWGGPDQDADVFVFDTALGSDIDVIMDFVVADDSIRLENSIFTKLTKTGNLGAGNFALDSAKDANDFIVYNHGTGDLAYDADGSGAGQAVVFAHIYNHAALTAADFVVI